MEILIKRIHQDAKIPEYQTPGSAGFDLHAVDSLVILPHQSGVVKTGLSLELEEGYELQIRPRSGLALKHGISVLNSPGTIDSDYRGEIMIILINHSDSLFEIKKGDRIAQGVVARYEKVSFRLSDTLGQTSRSDKGFGSTGIEG